MNYKRFEELPCWQKARELCQSVFDMISHGPFSKDFGLKDEVLRAVWAGFWGQDVLLFTRLHTHSAPGLPRLLLSRCFGLLPIAQL